MKDKTNFLMHCNLHGSSKFSENIAYLFADLGALDYY